jgi:hypothetical protein
MIDGLGLRLIVADGSLTTEVDHRVCNPGVNQSNIGSYRATEEASELETAPEARS